MVFSTGSLHLCVGLQCDLCSPTTLWHLVPKTTIIQVLHTSLGPVGGFRDSSTVPTESSNTMYLCTCVCMYVRTYLRTFMDANIRTHIHPYVQMYCIYAHTYIRWYIICTYADIRTYPSQQDMWECMCASLQKCYIRT